MAYLKFSGIQQQLNILRNNSVLFDEMLSEFAWAVELGEKGCFAGPALAHHEEGAPVGRAGQVAGRLLQLGRPPQEHAGGPAAQVGMVEDLGGGAALRRTWETGHFCCSAW